MNLKQHKKVVLMIVVENKGSSPGRQGFKMMLTEDGKKFGTVGGGATEFLRCFFKAVICKQFQELDYISLKKQLKNLMEQYN